MKGSSRSHSFGSIKFYIAFSLAVFRAILHPRAGWPIFYDLRNHYRDALLRRDVVLIHTTSGINLSAFPQVPCS
jgi:hypothetical protein